MKKLLEIAKLILDENPHTSLTGSLMLHLRGIKLGRDIKDIDILTSFDLDNISLPKEAEIKEIEAKRGRGYEAIKIEIDGIIVDFLESDEIPELVNGWRLGSVEELLSYKKYFVQQKNKDLAKHSRDIELIESQITNL